MAINRTKPAASKPAVQAATPPVTFNLQDPVFQQILAQAVEARLAAMQAEKPQKLIAGKSETQIKLELATIKAFRKLGITDVKPRENVLTFNRWVAAGFRPVEGSKAVKVANLRLFHASQVRKLTSEDRKTLKEQSDGAVKRQAKPCTVTPIHSPQ